MQREETSSILDPGRLSKIRDVSYNYIKLESSKIIADTFCDTIKLTDLFDRICENTDKKIVYSIKKKNAKDSVEIYLYYKPEEFSYQEYLDEVISLFTLLSGNNDPVKHSNIKKAMVDNQVGIVSYELDETGEHIVDYLDMYASKGETHRYNLNTDTLRFVSRYGGSMLIQLINYLNDTIKMNSEYVTNITNDISHIIPTMEDNPIQTIIGVHEKFLNNTLGVYCSPVDIKSFNTFLLERFGKNLPDNDTFKDLLFGFHLDYSLDDGTITGFGFCDYF
jgi:hypothetical protein